MRVYLDTSALLKRALTECESEALEDAVDGYLTAKHTLVSSTLAWIEVSRAVRTRLDGSTFKQINIAIEDALSGIGEWPIANDIVGLARRISPHVLRTLDAIHLATAVQLDADLMVTYDHRLAKAAEANGIPASAPA